MGAHDTLQYAVTAVRQPRLTGGTRLADRYEVEALVGAGASGAVYRARDDQAGGICALKIVAEATF